MKEQEKDHIEEQLKDLRELFNPVELKLLQLLTAGFTFEEAAEKMGISSDNSRKLKCNIYSKIDKRIGS